MSSSVTGKKRTAAERDGAETRSVAMPALPSGTHTIKKARFDSEVALEGLRAELATFAQVREWNQFHSPRNLVLALMGEVGELAEIFQWKGDSGAPAGLDSWKEDKLIHLGEELSDVLLYLIRIADRCNIDLAAAARRKLEINAIKYPADRVRGKSAKYNEYKQEWREAKTNADAAANAETDDSASARD